MFSLLAGIAVAETLAPFLGPLPMLKWPNDILLGGAKLAGILIDAAPVNQKLEWLVIGIGVNLRTAPEIPGRRTTSLAAHGVDLSPAKAAQAILARLSAWVEADANAIQAAWLARAHPIGTALQVQTAHQTRSGSFAGLSDAGELLLQTETRIEPISAGDVQLGLD